MRQKVRDVLERGRYAVNTTAIGVIGSVMRTKTLLATDANADKSATGKISTGADNVEGNIVYEAISQIVDFFPLVGAFFIVAGFFRLIMAYRSDNPEGQTGAAKDIVIGAVFIAFTAFWNPISQLLFKS